MGIVLYGNGMRDYGDNWAFSHKQGVEPTDHSGVCGRDSVFLVPKILVKQIGLYGYCDIPFFEKYRIYLLEDKTPEFKYSYDSQHNNENAIYIIETKETLDTPITVLSSKKCCVY